MLGDCAKAIFIFSNHSGIETAQLMLFVLHLKLFNRTKVELKYVLKIWKIKIKNFLIEP